MRHGEWSFRHESWWAFRHEFVNCCASWMGYFSEKKMMRVEMREGGRGIRRERDFRRTEGESACMRVHGSFS